MKRLLAGIALVLPLAGAGFASSHTAGAQGTTHAAQADKVHAGQDVFIHNCMQCHAVNEGQESFGPNLYGELKKPHPKKSAAEVKEIVTNGKGKMPAFKEKLAPMDTENLLAYLHTL